MQIFFTFKKTFAIDKRILSLNIIRSFRNHQSIFL